MSELVKEIRECAVWAITRPYADRLHSAANEVERLQRELAEANHAIAVFQTIDEDAVKADRAMERAVARTESAEAIERLQRDLAGARRRIEDLEGAISRLMSDPAVENGAALECHKQNSTEGE